MSSYFVLSSILELLVFYTISVNRITTSHYNWSFHNDVGHVLLQ